MKTIRAFLALPMTALLLSIGAAGADQIALP
jgi:hypothetical protein